MASTVWKGQLTFGLVSFPVRLLRAARKERVALKYVRDIRSPVNPAELADEDEISDQTPSKSDREESGSSDLQPSSEVRPVRQAYVSTESDSVPISQLQRGYEVAPEQFVVVRSEELRKLRPATSLDMQILRSVHMQEIDPVFLETSYYIVPGPGGERSYSLFYRALMDTEYAALAQLAMHGREHVMVIRAGSRGLIAHTMFYVNEVRTSEEFAAARDIVGKELDLAKKFVEAISEPFRPEEFTDKYREQLEALIASKEAIPQLGSTPAQASQSSTKVVDIMDALRKSLAAAQKKAPPSRKPAKSITPEKKPRRRRA